MGYYTDYNLHTLDNDGKVFMDEKLKAAMSEENTVYGSRLIDMYDWDTCKWYEHEEEMRQFSKRFPDVVFKLSGEGEESGDIWVKYFKGSRNCTT